MIVESLKELKLFRGGISNHKRFFPFISKTINKLNSYKDPCIIIPYCRTWNYEKAKTFSLNLSQMGCMVTTFCSFTKSHMKFGTSLTFSHQSCIVMLPEVLIPFSLSQRCRLTWKYSLVRKISSMDYASHQGLTMMPLITTKECLFMAVFTWPHVWFIFWLI